MALSRPLQRQNRKVGHFQGLSRLPLHAVVTSPRPSSREEDPSSQLLKNQNSVSRGSRRHLALVSGITWGGGEGGRGRTEERSDRGGETAKGKKHVTKVNH